MFRVKPDDFKHVPEVTITDRIGLEEIFPPTVRSNIAHHVNKLLEAKKKNLTKIYRREDGTWSELSGWGEKKTALLYDVQEINE